MGGNRGDTTDAQEVLRNRHRQRGAFFRIGCRAQLVEQHQRLRTSRARDEINVGDVRGKSREILFDRLIVANVGENGVEHGHFGAVGGDGNAGLGHQCQ